MASAPPGMVSVFGDANSPDIFERLKAAALALTTAQGQLATSCSKIGMTKAYTGEDSQMQLQQAIEGYARAAARHEMLTILSTEDFFVAMARSAGAKA